MPDPIDHLTPRDETDLFAAEYVIGLLDPAAHAVAARRRDTDPDFARAVETWEARLAPLIEEIGPVAVREDLWPRIASRLPRPVGEGGVWNSLVFWRGATALAVAAAATLAVVAFLPSASTRAPAQAPAVGEAILASTRLEAPNGQVVFVVTLDATNRRVVVTPIGADGAPGHSHELWLVPKDGKPVSLGVMPSDTSAAMPAINALDADSVLAISVEPEGGSPTGQPTGPVVAQGQLRSL